METQGAGEHLIALSNEIDVRVKGRETDLRKPPQCDARETTLKVLRDAGGRVVVLRMGLELASPSPIGAPVCARLEQHEIAGGDDWVEVSRLQTQHVLGGRDNGRDDSVIGHRLEQPRQRLALAVPDNRDTDHP